MSTLVLFNMKGKTKMYKIQVLFLIIFVFMVSTITTEAI